MIEFSRVSKRFRKVEALQSVSGVLRSGVVSGIMGPNGCGKTTLVKSILGLVIPDSGEIKVLGSPIDGDGEYRRQLGYLPQTPSFPSNLTVLELFRMISDIRETFPPRQDELVELFELQPYLERPFGVLSGGTKQKVATVVAVMFDPPILILDEPSVGLDPLAVIRLNTLLKNEAEKGKTVLIVTHILSEAQRLVSEMFFLLEGKIRVSGSLDAIQQQAGCSSLEEAIVVLTKKNSCGDGTC